MTEKDKCLLCNHSNNMWKHVMRHPDLFWIKSRLLWRTEISELKAIGESRLAERIFQTEEIFLKIWVWGVVTGSGNWYGRGFICASLSWREVPQDEFLLLFICYDREKSVFLRCVWKGMSLDVNCLLFLSWGNSFVFMP